MCIPSYIILSLPYLTPNGRGAVNYFVRFAFYVRTLGTNILLASLLRGAIKTSDGLNGVQYPCGLLGNSLKS